MPPSPFTCSLSDSLRFFFILFSSPIKRSGRPRDSGRTSDFPVSASSSERSTCSSSLSILRTGIERAGNPTKHFDGQSILQMAIAQSCTGQEQRRTISITLLDSSLSMSTFFFLSYNLKTKKGRLFGVYLRILVVSRVLTGRCSMRTFWSLTKYLVDC